MAVTFPASPSLAGTNLYCSLNRVMCVNDLLGVAAWQHSSPTNLKKRLTESGTSKAPFTRYNLLSNWLSNPFDNRVNVCIHNTTGCQPVERTVAVRSTRLSNRLSNRVVQPVWHPCWTNSLFVQHGCQTGCQTHLTTGMTTGWMFVYMIQPVVKPVIQPVVSCKWGLRNINDYRSSETKPLRTWHRRA